jgi:carbon-monoxide dehydrogenase large subunit
MGEVFSAAPRFVGARVERTEDPRLMQGLAQYLDDIAVPGLLEAAFVRSPHAAARIRALDTSKARTLPGVHAVFTFEDMPYFLGAKENGAGVQPALAHQRVRYEGEALALIVAQNRYIAEDACELVEVEYDPEEAVVDMRAAQNPDSRRIHAGSPNVFYHTAYKTAGFEEVFDAAPCHLNITFQTTRQTAVSLEPRGILAMADPFSGRMTVYCGTQSPHRLRSDLAELLGLEENRVRVIVPEVGGGFGMKAATYPEYLAVVAASLRLHQPVKWVSDRLESFLSDVHARDDIHDVAVAFDLEGRILAIQDHLMADGGAYSSYPFSGAIGETALAARVLTGPYDIPHLSTVIDCTYSNKVPLGAYRGVWGPVASFVQEGIADHVARYLHQDPADIRRRNMVRDAQLPYRNAAGMVYESGSFGESLERALQSLNYGNARQSQEVSRQAGRYMGIGISCFVEPTAMASSEAGSIGYESCCLRVEPDGKITAWLGLGPTGQGHETTMAQILADQLGADLEDIVVLHGDTDAAPLGGGTGGSRSGALGGGAAMKAGQTMRRRLDAYAAHLLEASVEDLAWEHSRASVRGVPSQGVTLQDIARIAYTATGEIPPGLPIGLEVIERYQPPLPVSFSNGTHAAIVEVDIHTGEVRVLDYVVINDCGTLINPMIVEGQIHGGVAQGVGAALFETLTYDSHGQLLTTTLMDYLLPSAPTVPSMRIEHLVSPSTGALGIKGMGEGSLIASPAAVAGAVNDALAPFGVHFTTLPITPRDIVNAVRSMS